MKGNKPAILFDFDGVIANTEPLYDIFIDGLGEKYSLGIDNFASRVKGVPTPEIVRKYFSHLGENTMQKVADEIRQFEVTMDIPPIDGALDFIDYLKQNEHKLALVTSSPLIKMERALKILNLQNSFDSVVTADRITRGKPDPMCFLLAAEDLNAPPQDCIVFEDSIHGIGAGTNAGMKVIGLTGSFGKERIKDLVFDTIANFTDREKLINIIRNH